MGSKLTRKQASVISALLTERTQLDAAKKAGVGQTTLYRWLARPDFQESYRTARMAIVEGAVGRLCGLSSAAVEALERNLSCGQAGAEIRAATAILEHLKGFLG